MAFSLNKVQLIGNVIRPPEVRMAGAQKVATFSVATNFSWTDQTGARKEKAEFHNIVAWRKLAEICEQYLKKGSKLYIEGRLQTRDWEGEDGVKRYRTEVIAENLQLGPKPKRTAEGETNKGWNETQEKNMNKFSSSNQTAGKKDEIPIVNENEPPSDLEIEEDEVKLKDVPF